MKNILLTLFFFCSVMTVLAQSLPFPIPGRESQDQHLHDSLLVDSVLRAHEAPTVIKPYSMVIRGFQTHVGLFTVHTKGDTVYFEIPDSILHRDIMVINRLAAGPGGFGAYPGEELSEQAIQFDKGPDSSIRIRLEELISDADSSSAIYKAVVKGNMKAVYATFPVLAYGKGSRSCVIDMTKFLKEDPLLMNNQKNSDGLKGIGDYKLQRVEAVHAYPINVELLISKSGKGKPGNGGPSAEEEPVSELTNTSFIELPKVPLQRRLWDPRVGYFSDTYNAFDDQQQKAEQKNFIYHWRLEPREEDREKWKNGQLVEPAKPIVFYIDPATPKQWRKYLILGINDWQKAFERAGFKNAIIGKEWPENDSTMHMDDARYSFINYFPSMVTNAYGPQVHDPRSGEIIQSHIGWYHNVMKLLHSWYMIQAGAVDPKARTPKFSDELMGQLVRFVSSHEVGHTLGLAHNFGSSSQTPVDSLRSRTWLEKHGHTASIMDYARFDYVAQPEDHIPEEDLFPRIGEYDCWAIEWGYKAPQGANEDEDRKIMGRLLTDSLARNPRLWWGDGETTKTDPRSQMEDLGDDAAKASAYGIKNLQRILPNLPAWTHEEGGIYNGLTEMYAQLKGQYFRYMGHVLRNAAGIYNTVQSEDGPGDVHAAVPKAKQRGALEFFNQQLFATPYWLMDPKVTDKVWTTDNFVSDLQIRVLNSLLAIDKLNRVYANSIRFGSNKVLTVNEYIETIHRGIWKELAGTGAIVITDPFRRDLQKAYIDNFADVLVKPILARDGSDNSETDAVSVIKADLVVLEKEINAALPGTTDPMTRIHLQDLKERVKKALIGKDTHPF